MRLFFEKYSFIFLKTFSYYQIDKKAIESSDLTNQADLNEFLEFEYKFETELANEIKVCFIYLKNFLSLPLIHIFSNSYKLDLNSSFIESNENNYDDELLLELEKEKFLFNQEQSQLNDLNSRVKEIEKLLAAEKTNLAKLVAQHSHIKHLEKTEKYEDTKLKSLIQIYAEKSQDYRILLSTKVKMLFFEKISQTLNELTNPIKNRKVFLVLRKATLKLLKNCRFFYGNAWSLE